MRAKWDDKKTGLSHRGVIMEEKRNFLTGKRYIYVQDDVDRKMYKVLKSDARLGRPGKEKLKNRIKVLPYKVSTG